MMSKLMKIEIVISEDNFKEWGGTDQDKINELKNDLRHCLNHSRIEYKEINGIIEE